MNELADVVRIENDRRSSGVPGRQVSQTAATLMIGLSLRWILNGRFCPPSLFHSKNPLKGTIHRRRITRSRYSELLKTVSLFALMVDSFVLKAGSQSGINCHCIRS